MALEKGDVIRAIVAERFYYFTPSLQEALETIRDKTGGPTIATTHIAELWKLRKDDLREMIRGGGRTTTGDDKHVIIIDDPDFDLNKTDVGKIEWYIKKALDYRDEIRKLPDRELFSIYENIFNKERLALYDEDECRFFNRPQAEANFDFWLKVPTWTPEEACALSFGKDPDTVNTTTLNENYKIYKSMFRDTYRMRMRLIEHAIDASLLDQRIKLNDFCDWAANNEIQVPAEIGAAQKRERIDISEYQKTRDLCASLQQQLDAFKANIEDLNPKNRRTLYLMVLVMAVRAYGHKFTGNTTATGAIAGAFHGMGLSISLGTVKAALESAINDKALSDEDKAKLRKWQRA